jgi:hypothetical protein
MAFVFNRHVAAVVSACFALICGSMYFVFSQQSRGYPLVWTAPSAARTAFVFVLYSGGVPHQWVTNTRVAVKSLRECSREPHDYVLLVPNGSHSLMVLDPLRQDGIIIKV